MFPEGFLYWYIYAYTSYFNCSTVFCYAYSIHILKISLFVYVVCFQYFVITNNETMTLILRIFSFCICIVFLLNNFLKVYSLHPSICMFYIWVGISNLPFKYPSHLKCHLYLKLHFQYKGTISYVFFSMISFSMPA